MRMPEIVYVAYNPEGLWNYYLSVTERQDDVKENKTYGVYKLVETKKMVYERKPETIKKNE